MADHCDYVKQLTESSRLVAEACGVTNWRLVYQSRSGPPQQPWLEPDVCDAIAEMDDSQKLTSIVIVPIGFVSDHMEVMFDLDEQAAELCRSARDQVRPRSNRWNRSKLRGHDRVVSRGAIGKDRRACGGRAAWSLARRLPGRLLPLHAPTSDCAGVNLVRRTCRQSRGNARRHNLRQHGGFAFLMAIGIEQQVVEMAIQIAAGEQVGMLSFADQPRSVEQDDAIGGAQGLQATRQDDHQRPAVGEFAKGLQTGILGQVLGRWRWLHRQQDRRLVQQRSRHRHARRCISTPSIESPAVMIVLSPSGKRLRCS